MNVLICNHCGTTNQKTAETNIDKLSVKVLNNGSDNGSYTLETEACQSCRQSLMARINTLMENRVAGVDVTLTGPQAAKEAPGGN